MIYAQMTENVCKSVKSCPQPIFRLVVCIELPWKIGTHASPRPTRACRLGTCIRWLIQKFNIRTFGLQQRNISLLRSLRNQRKVGVLRPNLIKASCGIGINGSKKYGLLHSELKHAQEPDCKGERCTYDGMRECAYQLWRVTYGFARLWRNLNHPYRFLWDYHPCTSNLVHWWIR